MELNFPDEIGCRSYNNTGLGAADTTLPSNRAITPNVNLNEFLA